MYCCNLTGNASCEILIYNWLPSNFLICKRHSWIKGNGLQRNWIKYSYKGSFLCRMSGTSLLLRWVSKSLLIPHPYNPAVNHASFLQHMPLCNIVSINDSSNNWLALCRTEMSCGQSTLQLAPCWMRVRANGNFFKTIALYRGVSNDCQAQLSIIMPPWIRTFNSSVNVELSVYSFTISSRIGMDFSALPMLQSQPVECKETKIYPNLILFNFTH